MQFQQRASATFIAPTTLLPATSFTGPQLVAVALDADPDPLSVATSLSGLQITTRFIQVAFYGHTNLAGAGSATLRGTTTGYVYGAWSITGDTSFVEGAMITPEIDATYNIEISGTAIGTYQLAAIGLSDSPASSPGTQAVATVDSRTNMATNFSQVLVSAAGVNVLAVSGSTGVFVRVFYITVGVGGGGAAPSVITAYFGTGPGDLSTPFCELGVGTAVGGQAVWLGGAATGKSSSGVFIRPGIATNALVTVGWCYVRNMLGPPQ